MEILLLVLLSLVYVKDQYTKLDELSYLNTALKCLDAEIASLSSFFRNAEEISLMQERLRACLYPIQKQHQELKIVEVVENLDLYAGDFVELLSALDILRFWLRNINEFRESPAYSR
jgi:hypothetical protein